MNILMVAISPDICAAIVTFLLVLKLFLLSFHYIRGYKRAIRETDVKPSAVLRDCHARIIGTILTLTVPGVLVWIFRVKIFMDWLKLGL